MDIKKFREDRKMPRRELAELFDVTERTISNWESGARTVPEYVIETLDHIERTGIIPQNPKVAYFTRANSTSVSGANKVNIGTSLKEGEEESSALIIKELLDQLKTKDEQINRLLSLLEKMN